MDFEKVTEWIRGLGKIASALIKLALKIGTLISIIKMIADSLD